MWNGNGRELRKGPINGASTIEMRTNQVMVSKPCCSPRGIKWETRRGKSRWCLKLLYHYLSPLLNPKNRGYGDIPKLNKEFYKKYGLMNLYYRNLIVTTCNYWSGYIIALFIEKPLKWLWHNLTWEHYLLLVLIFLGGFAIYAWCMWGWFTLPWWCEIAQIIASWWVRFTKNSPTLSKPSVTIPLEIKTPPISTTSGVPTIPPMRLPPIITPPIEPYVPRFSTQSVVEEAGGLIPQVIEAEVEKVNKKPVCPFAEFNESIPRVLGGILKKVGEYKEGCPLNPTPNHLKAENWLKTVTEGDESKLKHLPKELERNITSANKNYNRWVGEKKKIHVPYNPSLD